MNAGIDNDTRRQVARAVQGVESKKGEDIAILEMDRASGAFTDYFVVCSGTNPRQIQAISDEVEKQLAEVGVHANSLEGYNQAEWVLLDYVDFVIHIFSERARRFYDLERLWKSARRLKPADLARKATAKATSTKKASRKTASARPARRAKKRSSPAARGRAGKPARRSKSSKKRME
ncbi:MAG TPA: ribosome silencing factor [Terriglobales bacterium]